MKFILALLVSIFLISTTFCQNVNNADTIHIKSVIIEGIKPEKQEIGGKVSSLDKDILINSQTKNLAEIISDYSTISIKSMGQGALSTASFRGTSSSHTQVSWNGMVLNSPMVGNFDFSQIPVFFTDGIKLYHGAGGLRSSTGALGGNVNFTNSTEKAEKTKINILSEYGSNSTFTEGISLRKSFGDVTLSTRVYYQQSKNNYRYLNKVFSKDSFYERRKNAGYSQLGIMQEIYYDMKQAGKLSGIIWWQYDDRNLPQSIIVNSTSREIQQGGNLRSLVSYSNKKNNHTYKTSFGFLSYRSTYKRTYDIGLGDLMTINKSNSWIFNGEYSYKIKPEWEVGTAANYRLDRALSDSYASNISKNILTGRLFTSIKPVDNLQVEGQTLFELNGNKEAVTYNLGIQYSIIKRLLLIKASNAYNYRFPSLNDLYWQPGGNSDLKPEKGFSSDFTLQLTPKIGKLKIESELTYYHMDIKNWIMWIPTGNGYIWEPTNFSRVLSKGVETNVSVNYQLGQLDNKLSFNYGYAFSVDKSKRNDGTQNRQLPYIPLNKWNIRYSLNVKSFNINYNVTFTDIRYTSADQSYYTNDYLIHNAGLSYIWGDKKSTNIKTGIRIDNIFNSYYESTQYYPMPLRMFSINALFSL